MNFYKVTLALVGFLWLVILAGSVATVYQRRAQAEQQTAAESTWLGATSAQAAAEAAYNAGATGEQIAAAAKVAQ